MKAFLFFGIIAFVLHYFVNQFLEQNMVVFHEETEVYHAVQETPQLHKAPPPKTNKPEFKFEKSPVDLKIDKELQLEKKLQLTNKLHLEKNYEVHSPVEIDPDINLADHTPQPKVDIDKHLKVEKNLQLTNKVNPEKNLQLTEKVDPTVELKLAEKLKIGTRGRRNR